MINLTEEFCELVNSALADGNPMVLATVDEMGRPRLSLRGSTQVFSSDQLGFWARHLDGATTESIKTNPHVAMIYVAVPRSTYLQFCGRARLATPSERDTVYDRSPEREQKMDAAKKGVAVIIDLDEVKGAFAGADGQRHLVEMRRDGAVR